MGEMRDWILIHSSLVCVTQCAKWVAVRALNFFINNVVHHKKERAAEQKEEVLKVIRIRNAPRWERHRPPFVLNWKFKRFCAAPKRWKLNLWEKSGVCATRLLLRSAAHRTLTPVSEWEREFLCAPPSLSHSLPRAKFTFGDWVIRRTNKSSRGEGGAEKLVALSQTHSFGYSRVSSQIIIYPTRNYWFATIKVKYFLLLETHLNIKIPNNIFLYYFDHQMRATNFYRVIIFAKFWVRFAFKN